jgi:hypothetical protein
MGDQQVIEKFKDETTQVDPAKLFGVVLLVLMSTDFTIRAWSAFQYLEEGRAERAFRAIANGTCNGSEREIPVWIKS